MRSFGSRSLLVAALLALLAPLASCRDFLFHEYGTMAVPGCWRHQALWTGKEMLVAGCGDRVLLYDPAADAWRGERLSKGVFDYGSSAIWTGEELIVWGGTLHSSGQWTMDAPATGTGLRYDPATGLTQSIPASSALEPRRDHSAVWTGSEMLVWGGRKRHDPSEVFATGARFNPGTGEWRPISTEDAPAARYGHTAVWTGSEMLIWGEAQGDAGGRYDPASDSWSPMSASWPPLSTGGQPVMQQLPAGVWNGEELFVAGGAVLYAAAYRPASDTWRDLGDPAWSASEQASGEAWFPPLLWTGDQLLYWSNLGGLRWLAERGAWEPLVPQGPKVRAPPARFMGMSGVWTGTEAIFWGGRPKDSFDDNPDWRTGLRYQPATSTWRPTAVVMPDFYED